MKLEIIVQQKKHTSTVASRARDTNMEELQYLEPRSRRNLRGHYGKVYAMQWASDSLHLVSAFVLLVCSFSQAISCITFRECLLSIAR